MAASDFTAEPLDMTALGEKTVEEYLSKSEDSTEKQMLEKLATCNGNHFWTAEEKECLIFFMRRVGNDFDKLHSDYFPHRTQGALKTRYQKILRGEDTPASTPRLSVGNLMNQTVNEIVKAVTPRKPIKAIIEHEAEEENENEELTQTDELPEVNIEEKEKEVEKTEEQPAEQEEQMNFWMLALGPIMMFYLVLIVGLILPDDNLPETLVAFKTNFLSNSQFTIEVVREKLKSLMG
jgi:hypothetical protein